MVIKYGNRRSMTVLLFLTFIILLSPSPGSTQSLDDAARLNQQVLQLYRQGRYKEAIPLAEKALAIRDKALGPDHPSVAVSLNNLALLYCGLGDYQKAEPLYKRSLAIREKDLGPNHPSVSTCLNNLAELYRAVGDYQKAEPLHKRSLAIREKALGPDHPNVATSLNNLALIYKELGDYQKAEPLYKRSLALSEKALGIDHPEVATSLNNLAELYRAVGDYQKAEPLYKRSLAIIEKALGTEHPNFAASLNNLAVLYKNLGDYQKAEPLYKRSLAIREKALGPDHPDFAQSLNNLAELYRTLGDYPKAEPLYKRSLAIYEEALGPNHPDVAMSLNNQAALYYELGDYQKVEPLYKRSLAIYEKALGPNHPDVARNLENLALLYLDTGRLEEAYSIFKKTNAPGGIGRYFLIKKNYTQAEIEFFRSLDREKKTGRPYFLIGDYIGLGLSYEGQGDYKRAKENFQEAINIIEAQWKTLSPQAKKDFLTGKVGAGFSRLEPYERMVRVLVKERGKDAGKDSLTIAERVKGRIFLEMLATRQLRGKTKEDEAVLKKDREFQEALFSLRKKIEVMEALKTRIPQEEINRLKDELAKKEKEYTTFIEEVKLTGSELSSLLTVDPLSASKLQSLLDPATSLLEYFTTKDATYAWLITKDEIRVYEIPIKEKELLREVDAFLSPNISNKARKTRPLMVYGPTSEEKDTTPQERERNRQHFSQVSQGFYKDIVAPIEKDIKTKNLIIVPHGVLHKIPFSAISDGKNYLVERYSLSILPSASVVDYVVKKRKSDKDKILTLANPVTEYIPLDFAEVEGSTISRLFPKSELCVKEKATETLSKKRSVDFNIIHFASHGQFNERQPLQSGLLLAKDTENDGFLQVHEIFGLDLKNANLVTLSACETALSKIQGGDDLVGLSRGFIYAGTPSLLATLWEVDDQSTAILMEHFYKNWIKGMSKPEALRQAQIALKHIPQYTHPFYWAPFVMIGDWQ